MVNMRHLVYYLVLQLVLVPNMVWVNMLPLAYLHMKNQFDLLDKLEIDLFVDQDQLIPILFGLGLRLVHYLVLQLVLVQLMVLLKIFCPMTKKLTNG